MSKTSLQDGTKGKKMNEHSKTRKEQEYPSCQ